MHLIARGHLVEGLWRCLRSHNQRSFLKSGMIYTMRLICQRHPFETPSTAQPCAFSSCKCLGSRSLQYILLRRR